MPISKQHCIRVLVVDDEAAIHDAYRDILCTGQVTPLTTARQELRARLALKGTTPMRPSGPQAPATTFDVVFCEGAESGVAAVAAALDQKAPFAAAFLDMRMPPGPDGLWAAERIRQLDAEIEIVICSAYSDADPQVVTQRVPPTDKLFFLQKPFHPHELRQMAIALGGKWSAERHISKLAYFDSLTGLPNRVRFQQQLALAVEKASENRQQLALLYLDLDNFKRINDTLGHGVGDELLQLMADRLRQLVRRNDVIAPSPNAADSASWPSMARLGGDEFVVLLQGTITAAEVSAVAHRLLRSLREPLQLAQQQLLVTPSIGVAMYPADGADVDTLYRNADLAMYFAKNQGPGQVAMFNASMSAGALQRMALESKLRTALERNELSLCYQPQYDLASGTISGMEALLRWNSAELGSIPPSEFIPVAEDTGLIGSIGEWALRTACTQMKQWRDAGQSAVRVAVNVSALQFNHSDFPQLVTRILQETGLPPDGLELEITESLVMRNENWAKQALDQLKAIGVSLAIDDFGTGYSSLARLRGFSFDRLKIDRAFVQDMHDNMDDRVLITAIIKMAQTLGLGVVAEGVEEFAQLLHLQDEHCNEAQGYLLSRPLPVIEATALLQRQTASSATDAATRLREVAE